MLYGVQKSMNMCVMTGSMCMMSSFYMQKTKCFSCHADVLNMRMCR